MFRHTFVSILLSNPDIGVATVAAEAGHAQPSTTLAIYTQVYHKRQDSIRSQMSETLYKRKNSRKMKRDVQTLRLHVSFWWACRIRTCDNSVMRIPNLLKFYFSCAIVPDAVSYRSLIFRQCDESFCLI